MSARFFKILGYVTLAHVVVFSVLLVGFPAPLPRVVATFVYEGSLSLVEEVLKPPSGIDHAPVDLPFDHFQAADSSQWINIRNPEKPPP